MADFPSTIWTVIRDADSGRRTAATDLVTRYRPAVVRFARERGLDAVEAEDVAQDVFLRVFSDGVLARADAAKGRFRCLLLAVTRHVLGHHFENRRAQKRGGGRRVLSLDVANEVPLDDAALSSSASDPDFDREWFALVLSTALGRLEQENADYHRCLRAFLFEEKSQRAIAEELGKTEAMVRNSIARGKTKLVKILRDEIAAYASSSEELEDECRYLSGLIEK